MSSASKKVIPLTNNSPRPSTSATSANRRPSRSPTPSTPLANNGAPATRSGRPGPGGTPVSARAAVKRPGAGGSSSNLSVGTNGSDTWADSREDDARAETVAVIDDLKARLHDVEAASETYQRHLAVCQSRLDETLMEQNKLEDRLQQADARAEALVTEKKNAVRQQRDLERSHEGERLAMAKERDDMVLREKELVSVVQRLKEKLSAKRDTKGNLDEEGHMSRSSIDLAPSADGGHFAPSSTQQPGDSEGSSEGVSLKQIIESLRLELADAHIKLIESENMGGGRVQELEKVLLETRMTNARLMEDNESFQLLLSEKTLNGDFTKADLMQSSFSPTASEEHRSPSRAFGSSLADELESVVEGDGEGEGDDHRRLEAEIRSLKDQNKALTLYISHIIERLLNHKDFETILDKTPNILAGPNMARARRSGSNVDKDLPPPPPPEASGESVLQRAKSVAQSGRSRPRPMSTMFSPSARITSPTDDPATAPSIPLGRSQSVRGGQHRRINSELSNSAAVVGQMYRGPPSGSSTSPHQSPGAGTTRPSVFSPPLHSGNPNAAARIPSGSRGSIERGGDSASTTPGTEQGFEPGMPSPPNSAQGGPTPPPATPAAPIAGNKLRPLRLVQENPEAAADGEAAKRAKRGSWMGWFNKGKGEDGGTPGTLGF